jgi:ParB-like chromosome segregation protein Spo0J
LEVLELDPAQIKIGDRQRKELGDIQGLAESIKAKGQIHPIRIDKDFNLIAGGRRVAACVLANVKVQAIIRENTSELELRELELEENLRRKDLTWQEKVQALADLTALKQKIHGLPKCGKSEVGWSMGDTAELADVTTPVVFEAVHMAKAIEAFPELASAKNFSDAEKRLKKIEEKLLISELMKRKKATGTFEAFMADEHFIVRDAFEGMKTLPDGCINFANVDTPYGVDLKSQKKIQSGTRTDDDYIEWDKDQYSDMFFLVAKEVYRLLKSDSWALFWYGQEWYGAVCQHLQHAGFEIDKIPAVWYGGAGAAQCMQPEKTLARAHETFIVARKGNPIMVQRGHVNVFLHDKTPAQNKIHPTEKPLPLMSELLNVFVLPGQIGFSPFIGSGNDLRAGYIHRCHWFGFDLNQDVKNKFLLRVESDMKAGLYGNGSNK